MDTTEELPTVISFCSGYAGIERGLDLAGVKHRVIAYVEIEAFAIANLVAKMEAGELAPAPIWSNLKTFPAHLFRGAVDIITGGYPCQPFSAAGKRAGADDPRHLWPIIRRHTQAIRPSRVFFENVEGHISLGLRDVIGDLEKDGYRTTWGIFSAREVGAPHQRKRVFILAKRLEYTTSAGLQAKWNAPTQQATNVNYGCSHLGNSTSERPHRGSENCEGEQSEVLGERLESDAELADSASRESRQSQARNRGQDTSGGSEDTQWPARPGEEQYEWEEPRVTEAQSGLGGATNGTQHRVDRLRLLGNGVVPATAAKAWQILNARFNNG